MTRSNRANLIVTCLLCTSGALFFSNCRERSSPSPSVAQSQSVKAEDVWRENERIIENALAGRSYSIERFGASCDFFTRLTGIEIRGNGSYFGWLPNESTREDFRKVQEWYTLNKNRLYWDSRSKSVQIR
jgi:hypothetical protein